MLIPQRMYSLLETSQDIDQYLKSIYRYIHLGVHIRGQYSSKYQRFQREISEVVEFYVTDDNKIGTNIIYSKTADGIISYGSPSKYLVSYLENQGYLGR